MIATALTVALIVSTETRNEVCGSFRACYTEQTIHMREYWDLPEGEYTLVIPEGIKLPNFGSTNDVLAGLCADEITEASGMESVGIQTAKILCHEAKHAHMDATGKKHPHHR